MIKHLSNSALAILSAAVLVMGVSVGRAQVYINATMGENGNFSSNNGLIVSGGLATQTFFYPSATVLTYSFSTVYPLSSYVPVEGVLWIYDDPAHTQLSDVVVFAPNSPSYIYFISLDNDGDLADMASLPAFVTGPVLSAQVSATATEDANGVVVYTPTGPNGPNAQPGFMDNATITYTFVSGVVPEPSPVQLMGLALLGMGLFRISAIRRGKGNI
ncbi:MAG: hypothetical protein ABSA45_07585 [Verrucomicrobiota bacterium]|jgi:hypothetical protein